MELPGWGPEDWVKPGSCLAEVCGLEGHVCGSLDCVNIGRQLSQSAVEFEDLMGHHGDGRQLSQSAVEFEDLMGQHYTC